MLASIVSIHSGGLPTFKNPIWTCAERAGSANGAALEQSRARGGEPGPFAGLGWSLCRCRTLQPHSIILIRESLLVDVCPYGSLAPVP